MQFQKGMKPWNKGKKASPDVVEKIRQKLSIPISRWGENYI